ncbi:MULTISPECIES: hypothetical protein [Methylosinus]|uniref:hypothetical protein n=1 Tax=Methylosinus TaxID=425 RepID=UPI0001D2E564|nr:MULTISPECIES: hypothetical protein [Methylosinus]
MFQLYAVNRAGMGAFIRDFVRVFSSAGAASAFAMEPPPRESVVAADAEPQTAAIAPPSVPRPRRSGRLIDLERRAKFARFDATR